MRTLVLASLLLLASAQVVSAQEVRINGPNAAQLPAGLVETLRFLQAEQLESLKLFTTYLEKRVEEKAVPEGVLLNAQATYTQAQLRATGDPAVKREMLDKLVEIDAKRVQLDRRTPNTTWYGVNRVELGKMLKAEHEAFRKQAELPAQAPPRNNR